MYTRYLCLVLSLCFSYSASAGSKLIPSESDTYIGYSQLSGSGEERYEDSSDKLSYDYDTKGHRFSVGFISAQGHRFELSYSRYLLDFDGFEEKDDIRSVDIDGILSLYDAWVTPYIVLGLGFTTYRGSGDDIEGGADLDGFSFNYGGGLIFCLHPHFELDISYRANSISWESLYYDVNDTEEEVMRQNKQSHLMVAAHYIF